MQEATQKYWKLADYRAKYCYLSLLFPLLTATRASFAFLNRRVFSVLGHSFERHKKSFVLYIVSFSALKMAFSKLSQAEYHCLHKKPYFMSSITTKRLYKSYGSFIKRQRSGTTSDNYWQRVKTSGTTSDNEWQRVTTSGTTIDSKGIATFSNLC